MNEQFKKLINSPILLGATIGGAAGFLSGGRQKETSGLTKDEILQKQIIAALRGSILGTGVAVLPTLLGYNDRYI